MITSDQFQRLARVLPVLERLDPGLRREFEQHSSYVRLPAGREVFVEGDEAGAIALLLSGVVRVYKVSETGREITLYRFGLGESCILTANAILSRQTFPAIAVVEQEAEAVLVPAERFREWVRRSDPWRDFVFNLLSNRLAALMAVVEEVAFRRMDARLAEFLLRRLARGNPLRITHQEIAAELGSSREVISRLVEDLAARGILSAGRGQIEILDFERLEERARS